MSEAQNGEENNMSEAQNPEAEEQQRREHREHREHRDQRAPRRNNGNFDSNRKQRVVVKVHTHTPHTPLIHIHSSSHSSRCICLIPHPFIPVFCFFPRVLSKLNVLDTCTYETS